MGVDCVLINWRASYRPSLVSVRLAYTARYSSTTSELPEASCAEKCRGRRCV